MGFDSPHLHLDNTLQFNSLQAGRGYKTPTLAFISLYPPITLNNVTSFWSRFGHNEIGATKVLQSVFRLGARPRIRGAGHVCEPVADLHADRFRSL